MTLRTRLTLMVSCCFVAVSAILMFEGRIRQSEAEHRFEQAQIASDRNAWNGAISAVLRQLGDEIDRFSDDDRVVRTIADPDSDASHGAAVAQAATVGGSAAPPEGRDPTPFLWDLLARVRMRVSDADLELVRVDGTTVFASVGGTAGGPARLLAGTNLANVLTAQQPTGGLVVLAGGNIAVAVGVPIFGRGGAAGAVALLIDPAEATTPLELSGMISNDRFLVSPTGQLIRFVGDLPWNELQKSIDLRTVPPEGRLDRVFDRGSVLDATLIPLFAGLSSLADRGQLDASLKPRSASEGTPAAILIAAHDVTDSWRTGRLLSALSYAVALTIIALFLATLHWYLQISFRPLNAAIRVLNALVRGNTSVAGPAEAGNNEIGRLARAIESFRRAQKLLAETTAAKERIDSELAVAREIQRQIVPTRFGFPGHPEFELHALMEPAKAVGGDLYDFFLIDDRHLFFLIGDVSDKGVPAALFMAIAKALFKNAAQRRDLPLDEVMVSVNRQLSADSPGEMFVTIFACLLDLETGIVTYSDGGHELPMRLRADGSPELLAKQGGLALGFMPDYAYDTAEIVLAPGDALVLYTDGVNEAMNAAHELFSVDAIVTTLTGTDAGASAASVARSLLGAVRRFTGDTPQSDDITILVVRWKGPQSALARVAADVAVVS